MESAGKIVVGIAAVGAFAGLWWLYRPETEWERNDRRKRLAFTQFTADYARPYFVESSPTVITNIQRAASDASFNTAPLRMPDGTFLEPTAANRSAWFAAWRSSRAST